MNNEEYIGLDVGTARTGFARGASLARMAEPLYTVPTDQAVQKLAELAKGQEISGVVVGLPRNLDGNDTPQTDWVRQWVQTAKTKVNLPFYAQDEALTSKLAEAKKIKPGQLKDTDAIAAAIILQDFLDSPEAGRVVW